MRYLFLFFIFFITTSCSKNELRQALSFTTNFFQTEAASELDEAAYLRKLSLHLKGENPSLEEYENLQAAQSEGQSESYISKKIDEYLSSPQFVEKMNVRLNELFLLKSAASSPLWPQVTLTREEQFKNDAEYGDVYNKNSLNHLFRKVFQDNLSWDTLLTGHEYRVFNYEKFQNTRGLTEPNDASFFRKVYPGTLPPPYSYSPRPDPTDKISEFLDIDFSDDDLQIAGAITTGRFFNRYTTTNLNKNRRRAAALYRIFLCDDMVPVSAGNSNHSEEILDLVFPDPGQHPNPSTLDQTKSDLHGSDPACMKCHSKLDPVGRAFSSSPFILSPFAPKGVLNLENQKGRQVSVEFVGLRGLAKALTQQDRYVSCQTRHFWQWFVGENVALSAAREVEMNQAFETANRKPLDFIRYIVSSSEFKQLRQTQEQDWATLAKPILKRCQSCHSNHPEEEIPDFSEFPIGGSPEQMIRYTKKIAKSLALDGSNREPKMPPPEANWTLTDEQKTIMKNWIDQVLKQGVTL